MRKPSALIGGFSTALLLTAFALTPAAAASGSAPATGDETQSGVHSSFAFTDRELAISGEHNANLTSQLQQAAREALEARGFRYDPAQPDLLVELDLSVQKVLDFHPRSRARGTAAPPRHLHTSGSGPNLGRSSAARSAPRPGIGQVEDSSYHQSLLSINVFDGAEGNQVWEGNVVSRIAGNTLDVRQGSLDAAVTAVLSNYPHEPKP